MKLLEEKGIKIFSYHCNDDLVKCDANPAGNLARCAKCIKMRTVGLKLLDNEMSKIAIKTNQSEFKLDPNISIENLKKLKHHNFEVGYAILSSIVSILRDPYISVEKYYEFFNFLYGKSISLYDFFIRNMMIKKPDLVLVFNGRFAYTRALIRACEALNIPYYTHERGANYTMYSIHENTMPHDIRNFEQMMRQYWEDNTTQLNEKKEIGSQFFEDRAKGKTQGWYSFTSLQKEGLLPEKWNADKYNITIFLSSEDEFVAISDQWESRLFTNQVEGLKFLFCESKFPDHINFYIRIHPNSKNLERFIADVSKFSNDNVTVIEAVSPISSYTLLLNSDKIITFGSTIGIEATYWGKPSINLSTSFYRSLDVCYEPKNKEEIIEKILDLNLRAKNPSETLIYGYYLQSHGFPFKYYKARDFTSGTFNNKNIQDVKKITYSSIFKKIKRPYRFLYFLRKYDFMIRYYIRRNL
jgi:hypothetical protein